jgi:hypothetical protein
MRNPILPLALLLLAGPAFGKESGFQIDKSETIMPAGKKALSSVTITTQKGWLLNPESPITLKLRAPAGVRVDKAKLERADLAVAKETTARFDVGVTLARPGKQRIEAVAAFELCRKGSCRPIKENLTITAEATTPPAALTKKGGAAAKKKG